MPIITIDPAKKAEIDRRLALADVDAWFAGTVAEGFESDEGYVMGMSDADITLLTGNYVLAKEAAAMDLPLPPVIDRDGVPHSMESIEEMTALMLAYGQYRAQLSAEYATRKAAIG